MSSNLNPVKDFRYCFSLHLDVKTNCETIEKFLNIFQENFKRDVMDKIDSETEISVEPILKIIRGKSIGVVGSVNNE